MEEKVLEILTELSDDEIVNENHDVELFETGLIDSLAFVELLVEIERNFGISIAVSELDRTQVNTPNKLIEFIRKGMQA